jgi:prepilin-type processing-associated H-X9-DG protein
MGQGWHRCGGEWLSTRCGLEYKRSESCPCLHTRRHHAWGIGYRIGSNKKFEKNAIAMRHKGRANVLYFDGHVGQITAEQLNDPKFVEQLGGPEF